MSARSRGRRGIVTAAVGLSLANSETLARAQASALGVLAIRIAGAGLA